MGQQQQPLPPLTKCVQCGNFDRTTSCRFCGITKATVLYPVSDTAITVDQTFESNTGAVKVSFCAAIRKRFVACVAVIAPPDPDVGLPDPYPVEMKAVDARGVVVPLTYPEARYLSSLVAARLF